MTTKLTKILLVIAALGAWACGHAQQSRNDDMSYQGRQGQKEGESLLNTAPLPTITPGGERNGGTISIPGHAEIPVNQFIPGVDTSKVEALKKLKDADPSALNAAAAQKQQEVAQDPKSPSAAYRAIVDQHRQYSADLAGDTTLWSQANTALAPANLAAVQKEFADCKANTTYTKNGSNRGANVNHQVSCEDLHALSDATIERHVDTTSKSLTLLDNGYTFSQDFDIPFTVADPPAKIVGAQMSLGFGGDASNVVFTDYPSSFNSWAGKLHVTADPAKLICRDPQGNTCSVGSANCSCTEVVSILLTAQVDELVEKFVGTPSDPLMASDGFCTAQWTCTDATTHEVGGVTITPDMLTPLYPTSTFNNPNSSMSPTVCWKASATYQCPFNLGNFGCWVTPSGQTQCHTNTVGNTAATPGTTCTALRNNPKCGLQLSECAENATGYGGTCYVTTNVYNCPDSVSVDDISSTTHFDCAGTLRCAGEDCLDSSHQETNSGFLDVQGKLTVLQHMLSDTTTDTSGTTPVSHPSGQSTTSGNRPAPRLHVTPSSVASSTGDPNVRLFPGQAFECRKALGSTIDCCTETQSQGTSDWMKAYTTRERQGNAQIAKGQAAADGDPARGAWADYAQQKNWTLATRGKALTSRQETVTEDQNSSGGSTDVSLGAVMHDYRTTKSGDTGLKNTWTCTAEELDLATQREAGACANIGSYCSSSVLGACIEKRDVYCCFNSPMSLAIRLAQVGGQQGIANGGFGTPQHPNCAAVSTDIVSTDTVSKVSTDDWIGRLQQTGALPTTDNVVALTNVDRLTGSGSSINPPGTTRPNVVDRTQARLSTIDVAGAKLAMENQARSATPAPQPEPSAAGAVSFAPAFNHAPAGLQAFVQVRRQGSLGAVSVDYATADETAIAGNDYIPASGTLHWADGESGSKTFVVKTLANATSSSSATAPLQFGVRLANPTGGATLEPNDIGEVVLDLTAAVQPVPGANQPHLTVTKVLASQIADTSGGVTLTYQITAANDGLGAVANYFISDIFPAGSIIRQWGTPGDSKWQTYCPTNETVPQGSPPWAYCSGALLPQGAVFNFPAVVYLGNPGASVTNVCQGSYTSSTDSSQYFYTGPTMCTVTSAITASNPAIQACTQRGGMNTGLVEQLQDWPSAHPVPYANGVLIGTTNGTQADITMPIPQNTPLSRLTMQLFTQGIGANYASVAYARISPCPGDLSLPTNTASDPFSMQSCTLTDVGNGAYTLRDHMTIEITSAFPSDQGTCRLPPGQTYYVNITTSNPSSGTVSPAGATCQPNQTCYVNFNAY